MSRLESANDTTGVWDDINETRKRQDLKVTEKVQTRPNTRQHQSRAGGQGQHSSWAGAVTQI